MSKIIGRVAIIGLIVGGIWYLSNNSNKKGDTDNKFVEIENTENPAKKSDEDLTFEIKKGDGNVKSSPKKEVVLKKSAKETAIIENKEDPINEEKMAEPVVEEIVPEKNNQKKLTQNIGQFIEGEASNEISVYFYEYEIDLSKSEVPAGNVTFRAINNGRLSHNLTIKDGNGQVVFGRVAPGETKYFKTNLAKSNLEVLSIVRADTENDMTESLSVK